MKNNRDAAKKFKADFYKALREYFQADTDPQGGSDADTVFDIFVSHLHFYEVHSQLDPDQEHEEESSSLVDLDEEGLHVAQTYGTVFHTGVLGTFDTETRLELLEACIYALNKRFNEFEHEVRKRWHEKRNRGH